MAGFNEVGGYNELIRKYAIAEATESEVDIHTNVSCSKPPDYAMHFWRDATPGKSDLPWTGLVFGLTISAVWYWCSDQVSAMIVTHTYSVLARRGP